MAGPAKKARQGRDETEMMHAAITGVEYSQGLCEARLERSLSVSLSVLRACPSPPRTTGLTIAVSVQGNVHGCRGLSAESHDTHQGQLLAFVCEHGKCG